MIGVCRLLHDGILSDSFVKNFEEFIPTNEWQIVKEGMEILL